MEGAIYHHKSAGKLSSNDKISGALCIHCVMPINIMKDSKYDNWKIKKSFSICNTYQYLK